MTGKLGMFGILFLVNVSVTNIIIPITLIFNRDWNVEYYITSRITSSLFFFLTPLSIGVTKE